MRTHNEKVEVTVTAHALDLKGNPYVPVTARYKLTDCRSEEVLIDWTNLAPALSMEIVIPGDSNAMVSNRKYENKVVTVNTDSGLDSQHYEEYEYKIESKKFVE